MHQRAHAANPRILTWAREKAGFSLEDAAHVVRRPPDIVAAWESGSEAPTYGQLEKLADKYRRPLALFFFPDPPDEKDLQSEFRTIPAPEFDRLEPDTKLALRQGLVWQESLRELSGGVNPAGRLVTRDIVATLGSPVQPLAARVRKYLGVDLEHQQLWRNQSEAFKGWRRVVEDAGVFIFKRSFDQHEISGFCLHDDEFPIIVINNSTATSRQIFTVFHELSHLLYGVSGFTDEHVEYSEESAHVDPRLEIACNRLTAELLLPQEEFPWHLIDLRAVEQSAVEVGDLYNVSREVVLRRLLDEDRISVEVYRRLVTGWNEEFFRQRAQGGGGNYYATKVAYLGDTYIQLAFTQYHAGRISLPELADHLGVRARNITRLEDFFLSRRSA